MQWILENVGENQFLPSNAIVKWVANWVCGFFATNPLCDDIIFLITGPNSNQLNKVSVGEIHNTTQQIHSADACTCLCRTYTGRYFDAEHSTLWTGTPIASVLKQNHSMQQANSDKYQMFDYGSKDANEQNYHQVSTFPRVQITVYST